MGQVSSAFAVLFAFLTVWQAGAQWRLGRRGSAYDLVVLDPIRLGADHFVEESLRLIADRVELMETFTDEKDVQRIIEKLTAEFNDSYLTLKSRVVRANRSWPFDDLSDVENQIVAVQDRITPLLARLPNAQVDFADELDGAVGDVMAVVLQYAPALKKGWVKRMFSWGGRKLSAIGSTDRRKKLKK